ncbi:MAG: glycosyltransferase [Chloroflexi bacterium]|nr:glycosyltransferase [Chloroflexota bacterium]
MVTTSYPKHAGDTTAPFIAAIAEGVAARGLDVGIVLPAHPALVGGVRAGVRLHPYHYALTPQLRGWGYAEALAGDVRLRRSAYAAAPLALGATLATTLAVARRQPGGLVHAHWVIPNGPPAALVAALLRRSLVVSLHGSDVHLAERAPFGPLARWVFRRAGAITACSPDLATRAIAIGADPARVTVVPYGVDGQRFRPDPAARARVRARLALADGVPLVVGLGRMVYKKGFAHAVAALARLACPDAVLALVGDGDVRPELEAQARQLGLGDRVRFPGAAGRDETPAWFAAADVFVLPSIHDRAGNVDGLPNVLLEAMASGGAIVATDLAGVRLVMDDGADGLIVPEGDSAVLATALDRLLADPPLRIRMGAAARQRATTALTWARCVDGMLAAYAVARSGVPRESPV